MEARTAANTERPPKHPGPNGFALGRPGGNSYVQRFKIKKEHIKTLHETNKENTVKHSAEKTLPKLPGPFVRGMQREDTTGLRKFTRSNTIDSVKLPGVGSGSVYSQAARRKEPVPVKTFHLKLNPEHASLLSKSLPSLPSIPGSPSQEIDPPSLTERSRDFKSTAFPAGRHRFQKIAYQKTIHFEKSAADDTPRSNGGDIKRQAETHYESVYNNVLPHRAPRHQVRASGSDGEVDTHDERLKSNSTLSHTRHHSRRLSKESAISETRSEGGYVLNKKWKDNCNCMRCQMLRRQYKEGDDQYMQWGQYPCHRVDMSVTLDDDD